MKVGAGKWFIWKTAGRACGPVSWVKFPELMFVCFKKPDVVAGACKPSTGEAGTGSSLGLTG